MGHHALYAPVDAIADAIGTNDGPAPDESDGQPDNPGDAELDGGLPTAGTEPAQ
jgi:hypothetical protein